MRLLLICNSFGKGHAATAHLAAELCEGLADRGVIVDIWARGQSSGYKRKARSGSIFVHGIDMQCFQRLRNRHVNEFVLLLELCRRALFSTAPYDCVICMDTPRFSIIPTLILKLKTGALAIAWVMDLAFEQVTRRDPGTLKALTARVMMNVQYRLWRSTDHIVVLGQCMSDLLLSRGVRREQIHVIGTWAEDHWGDLMLDIDEARTRYGLNASLTIMYSGFAAPWHDFDSIADAISQMSSDDSVQWIFAGLGPGIEQIRLQTLKSTKASVLILDRVNREELPLFLSCADVHLVSLKPSMIGTCVPSKLYPLMALGKPVLFVGPAACQTSIDLANAQAGHDVDSSDELVKVLRSLVEHPERLHTMGHNARNAFKTNHSASTAIGKWIDLLRSPA